MSSDGLMSDPYASKGGASAAGSPPSLPGGWAATPDLTSSSASPDFLFPESDYDEQFRRSWGERLTYHVGSSYLVGARPAPAPRPPARAAARARRPPRARADRRVIRVSRAGLAAGGVVGVGRGLRESAGERQRIRINSVLNTTGRLGPGWGNSLGCIAMMCSIFESIAYNVRGEDDLLNAAGAAALTGSLYKITAGPRAAATMGLGLGAVVTAGAFATKQLSQRGMFKKFV
jgi:import inner membrane translocase subunit TIM23